MLSLRINGKRYTRSDVVGSGFYDRATGYIHLTFNDGVSVRIDAAGILVA